MTLTDRLEQILDEKPRALEPLHGGLAQVYLVTLRQGRVVAKVDERETARLTLEGFMLDYLRDYLRVPEVLYADDSLLVLEHIAGGSQYDASTERDAAERLAALHEVTAAHYGFERDTLIGGLPQANPQMTSWLEFFREARLRSMMAGAIAAGRLPPETGERLEQLMANLSAYLDEPPQPSLIHGDVWSGNVLAQEGCISGFLDPAIYYADAEMELAFIRLFNTFGKAFFDTYSALRSLRAGFEERQQLLNLYPLLVHVRLFGGHYVQSVERTLKRFGY